MSSEQREYYNLEEFWSEAPRLAIVEGQAPDLA
jgi:ribosomal silencing factor RsfS